MGYLNEISFIFIGIGVASIAYALIKPMTRSKFIQYTMLGCIVSILGFIMRITLKYDGTLTIIADEIVLILGLIGYGLIAFAKENR